MHDLEQAKQELAKAPAKDPSFARERLRLLLEKSIQLYRDQPKEARKWATEALALAHKVKNKTDEGRSLLRLGCVSFQLCEYARAVQEVKRAIKIFEKADPESSSKSSALLLLGMAQSEMGQLREAMGQFEQVLKLNVNNPSKRAEVFNEMANASMASADYPEALEYLHKGLAIFDDDSDSLRRSVILSNIGKIYLEVDDLEKADSFFEKSAVLAKEVGDTEVLKVVIYNRGLIHQKQKDLAMARSLFSEALELSKALLKPDSEAYISESLGTIALESGEFNEALRLFKKAVNIATSLDLARVWTSALIGEGKAQTALHRPKKGITALQEALRRSEANGMPELECESSGALAKAFEASGNLKQAVSCFNRHIALSSELHSQQRQRAIVEISARVEIEKADRERARMEKLVLDANKRAELLHAETERQTQELTQLALHLVQKNEFLCDLRAEIEPAIKSSRKGKAIMDRIDDHIKSDRDWETFENQFNQIHRKFLTKLSAEYPSLTPAELKIAVMIKLSLPTKAIANLFCLSERTVENHRQAIRHKLNLRASDNLVSFLTGFGEAT